MQTYGSCNLTACRFNDGNQCKDEPNRAACLNVCQLVLGAQYEEFCQWQKDNRTEKEDKP